MPQDPTDYSGHSLKDTKGIGKPEREKITEPIVTNEVIVQKKKLGQRMKDFIVEADFKSVARYVVSDVMLPALRNLIVDASTKGIERAIYGDKAYRASQYGGPTRFNYSNPISRPYSQMPYRNAPPVQEGPRTGRQIQNNYIVGSKKEGELIVERLNDIVDKYETVTVGELHELLNLQTSPIDQKWGWAYVGNVPIRQVREGWLIDLPPEIPLQ